MRNHRNHLQIFQISLLIVSEFKPSNVYQPPSVLRPLKSKPETWIGCLIYGFLSFFISEFGHMLALMRVNF